MNNIPVSHCNADLCIIQVFINIRYKDFVIHKSVIFVKWNYPYFHVIWKEFEKNCPNFSLSEFPAMQQYFLVLI